ncbi:hypothetical protein Tco_1262808 [Tanacetum coccineum]
MHVRCGRMSVPGPCSQHARNQILSIKGESGDEATITPNIERSSKPKRKAGEFKQVPIQICRKVTPFLRNPQKGSSKRGLPDGKGLTTSTSLFRQSCLTNPKNQLQLNGKTSFSIGARHGEAEEILSSTPNGEGEEFTYALRFEFDASNNEAEYEALVAGLRIAEQMA